ncbi:Glycosyltransferase family 1 protein [Tumidithrix helvetica PCC 7403]|uniref:glycosyltransferase family 4 protein n=1 Tax=Tumidithrix helvetica TaxID=3457545 RepID=UPI003C8910A3
MKIAMTHVDLPNESKGGVAFQAHYLANVLVERGHDVTMFTFSPWFEECRYQVHQYAIAPKLKKFHAFLLAGNLAKTDFSAFDIVHTHGDNFLLFGKHPQVRTFHGSAIDEALSAVTWRFRAYQTVFAGLEKVGAWIADVNVGVSKATQKRIPAVSIVVPNGVDTDRFSPGQKSEHPSILFVGTTGGRKRGEFLAEIFRQQVRTKFPQAELWTVAEKPMEGEGILNFGRVSQDALCELYRRAWIFCLPSTYEGFGIPYVEALAAGTPTVASLNVGAREILEEGKYGILAEDDQIGNQINLLLENENLRQKYAELGLVRSRDFSWELVAQKYEQIYADAIAKHKS